MARVRAAPAYASCFISYAYPDRDFADRLHSDLSAIGVTSWLDTKDLEIGSDLSDAIHKAIQAHDKVLPILSETSLRSSWVRAEIRHGLTLEAERRKSVLFPLRVDDAVFGLAGVSEIEALKRKQIGDFTNWRDPAAYQREFSRLARALAISTAIESEARA